MAFKKPWWAKLGNSGTEAISRMASFGTSARLRRALSIRNYMPAMRDTEVGTAAMTAGVDPATARRLDVASSADRALRRHALQEEAGVPGSMRDPRDSRPVSAALRADFDRRIAEETRKRQANQGLFGKIDDWLIDVGVGDVDRMRFIDAKATGDPAIIEYAREKAGYARPGEEVFGQDIMKAGQKAVEAVGTTLSAISSPLTSPQGAGNADHDIPEWFEVDWSDPLAVGKHIFTENPVADYVRGVENIATGSTSDAQKEDMRRAGYNPDSWSDRYGWYADIHAKNNPQSDQVTNLLKSEGKNPYKVDLVREIVTSGVDDDPARWRGLSEDGQRLLKDIQAGIDTEAADIFKVLHANQTSLGANAALAAGLRPGDAGYTATSIIGDLAAYWYLDPLVVGGKALNAYRYAKFGVEVDPHAVREAIAKPGSTLAKRWDDILDSTDKIHVLSRSSKAEDQAAVAAEYQRLTTRYPDVAPLTSHLLRMREGSVTGTVLRRDELPANADWKDLADFRANVLDVQEVADPAKYKPVFALRQKPGDKVTPEMRDAARAEIADRLSDAVFADAILSGRPIVGDKILLPGQHRFSTPIATGLRHTMDAVLGQKGKLLKQLKDAEGKGLVDLSKSPGGTAAHLVDSAKGGEWIRENYTRGGIRDRLAMTASRFGTTTDRAFIRLDDAASTKDVYNFARFFMPRGQASYLAVQWAQAAPATRSIMLSNLMDSLGNARLATDGKASTDFFRQQLKQRESVVRPGDPVREAYSTRQADLIDTEAGPVAAAMYSTQFNAGWHLPSYLEILRNTERVGILSAVAGWSHSRYVTAMTRAVKVGQVGTTSNMMRQALDGRGLQVADDPLGAFHAAKTRLGLVGETAAERAAANVAFRDAKKLVDSGKLDMLTPLHARGAFDEYAAEAAKVLGGKISPRLDELLRQGADVTEVARARSAVRLAAARVAVDPLRRGRATLYERLVGKPEHKATYDWLEHADERLGDRLSDAASHILGGEAARYMDPAMVDDLEQMRHGLEAGQRLRMMRLRNVQGYLGAAGDVGATRWGNALGMRLADPVGKQVLQAVAASTLREMRVGSKVAKAQAKANTADPAALSAIEAQIRATFPAVPDARALAGELISKDETYRLYGRRGQYIDGKHVGGTPDQDAALKAWGEQMVDDAAHYLGLTTEAARKGQLDPGHLALLKAVSEGKDVTQTMLAKVGDDVRPPEVHAPVIMGKQFAEPHGGPMAEKVARGASKMYDFVVANPLRRMVHDPQVLAAHNEIAVALEPVARAMQAKGLSPKAIYDQVDALAYGHAINRVLRYNDNPHVQSYFAVLSNNLLWYERAMEDWGRRAMNIVKADPAVVARAHLMWEAAAHSGIVHKSTSTDEEGNEQVDYMFTWPGSGLFTRAVNEAAQALNLTDKPIISQPVWQDWSSPVRYLSPSLQNPLGFTTTPLVGMPLRLTKLAFPEFTLEADSLLTTLEGGERSFGQQDMWEALTPVYLRRAMNALSREERDSQFASAMRNAMVYMEAAGRLPETDAPEADHQRARDELRQMVGNLVLWRNITGAFLPATPGTMNTNVSGIGDDDLNVFDRARGVTTIRGEWFQLLEDMTARYPNDSNRAFSEAATEWMRRDMGSIVDPAAFTVGTSTPMGVEDGAGFSSNLNTTQWMLDNASFLSEYGQAAFKLLPQGGGNYYDKLGYQVQLRTDVRKHKELGKFYEDLVVKDTDTTFYALLDERRRRLDAAPDKAAQKKVYDWFNASNEALRLANPIWAMRQNDTRDVDYISSRVAPQVLRLAEAADLPPEVAQYQPQLQVMSALWTEYREELAKRPGTLYSQVQARKDLTKRYTAKGDELFGGTALNDLWKTMKAWED